MKGPGTKPQSSNLFKQFLKIIALVYIYQLAKFGDLLSCGSKDTFKKDTNTHHDVTDLLNHRMFKNTQIWISWEWNIIVLQSKKIINMCLRWHILRSYLLLAEVTFNISMISCIFQSSCKNCIIHQLGKIFSGIIFWISLALYSC